MITGTPGLQANVFPALRCLTWGLQVQAMHCDFTVTVVNVRQQESSGAFHFATKLTLSEGEDGRQHLQDFQT